MKSKVQALIEQHNENLSGFIQRWSIIEFGFFGSVMRPDFQSENDIDVLVAFSPEARWSLLDLVRMQQELEDIFSRPVDLVEKGTIQNPFRLRSVMENYRMIYA